MQRNKHIFAFRYSKKTRHLKSSTAYNYFFNFKKKMNYVFTIKYYILHNDYCIRFICRLIFRMY